MQIVRCQITPIKEDVDPYQIIREFELEERYGFSRDVVPGETGIVREIPRFNHVGIILMKDSISLLSSRYRPGQSGISYISIPLVA